MTNYSTACSNPIKPIDFENIKVLAEKINKNFNEENRIDFVLITSMYSFPTENAYVKTYEGKTYLMIHKKIFYKITKEDNDNIYTNFANLKYVPVIPSIVGIPVIENDNLLKEIIKSHQ